MPTANDLIKSAAIKLGAIATGETLTADEASDSLSVLNSMLDAWKIDRLMVYQIVQNTYSWTAAAASKTIGSGGDFNTTRPVKIEDGTFFRDSSNIDYIVTILKDRASYDRISSKTVQSTYPEFLYYEPGFPLGIIYAYPVPSGAITLHLNEWQVLQNFSTLTTSLSLPPGYQWAIEHNLAVYLEPVFDVPVPSSVLMEAGKSKKAIKRINHVPVFSETEVSHVLSGRGKSDIYAGTP